MTTLFQLRGADLMTAGSSMRLSRQTVLAGVLLTMTFACGIALAVSRIFGDHAVRDAFDCERGKTPPVALWIYVDNTDMVPASELAALKALVQREVLALPAGSRVAIRRLAPDSRAAGVLEPVFDRCKPRNGDNANHLTSNSLWLDKRFEQGFRKPLEQAVGTLSQSDRQVRSPIIQGLNEIAADPAFRAAPRRMLIIAGDMLESSKIANHYRPGYTFRTVKAESFEAVGSLRGSLDGAQVQVLQLRNAEARAFHTPGHRAFWRELFEHAGVSGERYRYEQL